MKFLITFIPILTFALTNSYANESTHPEQPKVEKKDDHKDEHGSASEHADKEEDNHGGEHEESSVVGPEKGIVAKGKEGFKLSPESTKTMAIETMTYSGGNVVLDRHSIVFSKDEKSIFRLRNGWFKRIPIHLSEKTQNSYIVSSSELSSGDQIVVLGTGFLKIAEVFVEEGDELSHAH